MKQILIFINSVLFLSVFLSCNNESLINQDHSEKNQSHIKENNDSIQTRAYCFRCLPMITAYDDFTFKDFVIAWSGYTANPESHPVTISYNVAGRSGSQRILYNSGEIRKEIYSETYRASWTIKCDNDDCSSCTESGSLYKNPSGEIEINTGSENDCFKEYLNYSIQKIGSSTYELNLNDDFGNVYNTEKYMRIDNMRCYETGSYGQLREIYGACSLDTLSAPYRIRFTLYDQPMHKNFRAVFSSSECKNNKDHYLYVGYYSSNFGFILSNSSLILARSH